MSDCERFAHIAEDKWATVSESLRLIRGNERMSDLLKKICLQKSKILFFNFFSMFYIHFFWKNEQIPHFLFFSEQSESIPHVAHQKWAMWANCSGHSPKKSDHERFAQFAQRKWKIVNKSLRSLTKNEWIAHFFERIAHFWAKHKRFSRKSDERIPSPARKS